MTWHQQRAAGMHRLPSDIVGYTFKAANYCPDCIIAQVRRVWAGFTEAELDWPTETALDHAATALKIDRTDEHSFDSDTFPKVVFRDMLSECDVCDGAAVVNDEYELHRPCTACNGTGTGERCGSCGAILGE
jgi:hypothetical protein